MSIVTPLVDTVDDLWPADGAPEGDLLAQLVLASNLLGANRAVSNFGGGNTSAKGTATDHAGREVEVMWVKGSGSDLATMGAEHFTGLRMDEMLPLMERSEMSDEDMVAYLARCQLDPKMPRASIETLLHAFVPAPHVHHTHPDGINVLAGHGRRRAPGAGVLRRQRRVDPLHPARLHALAPGRRGGAREPRPQARRARQARPRRLGRQRRGGLPAHDRGHQPGGRVRQRAHRRHPALRRAPPGRRTARAPELLRELLPGDPRRGLERAPQAADARHLRRARSSSSPPPRPSTSSPSAPRAPTTSCTPSACRCGSPTTPRPTTPRRCASASPSARRRSGPTTAPTSRPTATRRPSRPTRTRGSC